MARVLQGDGTDVAALQVHVEFRAAGAPPQTNRHVASAGGHVEDAHNARRDRPSQAGQLRPEDAGAVAEDVDARQVAQGANVPLGTQIRLIHDLRAAKALTDQTHETPRLCRRGLSGFASPIRQKEYTRNARIVERIRKTHRTVSTRSTWKDGRIIGRWETCTDGNNSARRRFGRSSWL